MSQELELSTAYPRADGFDPGFSQIVWKKNIHLFFSNSLRQAKITNFTQSSGKINAVVLWHAS